MKFRSSLALLVVAAVAAACYNDSDTNLTELRDNLNITYAIAGRFTIYPPEYYKRRIEIQTANLKKNPNDLNAYDNLAVAYDHIGKHDEAIATIRKERALLDYSGVNPLTEVKDELVPNAPPVNHRYTVEANEGTFLIHRWISNGGNPKNLTDAVEAEKHIAKAIEINPNAHFGREFAQLYCMRAILKGAKEGDWKRNFTENLIAIADQDKVDRKALRKGIAGMMVLGNAWNSPVMLKAIAYLVPTDGQVVELAQYFSQNLMGEAFARNEESDKPLNQKAWDALEDSVKIKIEGKLEHHEFATFFPSLEENAQEFRKNRESWIKRKLATDQHPDSSPDFWTSFKDTPPLPRESYQQVTPFYEKQAYRFYTRSGLLLIVGIGGLFLRDRIRKRNARNT
jgi:tetratricopeptide (TPR) repeat protein